MPEQRIGKYLIESELGRGAMGVVYKAVDPVIGRTVAIKTIRFDVLADAGQRAEAQKRFLREAQSAGGLSHPNIVTIYDIGEAEGLTYIAMEYVEGPSLESLLASGTRWTVAQVVPFAVQLASALDAAHRKGIVHRDIKPGNILVDGEGRPHIVDFGIARLSTSTMTQTSMVMGTPFYMAPEQVAGRKVDHRADLFSLGAVLYEMLTLEKPFAGETLTTVIYKIMNEPPPPLRRIRGEIPEGIAAVVEKALAKETAERYASCGELMADLNHYLAGPAPVLAVSGKKDRRAKAPAAGEKAPAAERAAAREASVKPREDVSPAGTISSRRKPLLLVVGLMMGLVAVIAAILLLSSRKKAPVAAQAGGSFKVEISEKGILGNDAKNAPPLSAGMSRPETGKAADRPPAGAVPSVPSETVPQRVPATEKPEGQASASGQTPLLETAPPPAGRKAETAPPSKIPGKQETPARAGEEPARPAPSAKPGPTRLPRLVRQVDPVYPADALAARIEGDVKLEITIGFSGKVEKARIVKSVPKLDMAALDAVGKWEFEPGLFEGIPIQATLETTIHFALPPGAVLPPVQSPKPAEKPKPQPAPPVPPTPAPAVQVPLQATPAQKLAQASEALNRGAYRDALAAAEALLAENPGLDAAKTIALDAVIRLAPGEIKDLVDQYALSYKIRQPAGFFRDHAVPDVYQRLRPDLEMMTSAYLDIQIAISNLKLDFQAARHPTYATRAVFAQVMTGLSAAKGSRMLMFDGRYSWILERRGGEWTITSVKVE